MSEADLTSLMLGRELTDAPRPAAPVSGNSVAVRVNGLVGRAVTKFSANFRSGEVLGITGIAGAGHEDIPYLLTGVARATSGTVSLSDQTVELPDLNPGDAIAAGIALVPEGREKAGLAMGMSTAENIAFPLSSRRRKAMRPLTSRSERRLAANWVDRLDVRPVEPGILVKNLSGGNQQKVLLAKWLATEPSVLILHEPTQAVDVGARHTIVAAIRSAARTGCTVIVVGSDENELSLLCDRILVFDDGVVREELTGELTPDRIVEAIYVNGSRSSLRRRSGQCGRTEDVGPLDSGASRLPSPTPEEIRIAKERRS